MSTTYTPTISTDSNGEEFVDFDNGSLSQRDQFHRGITPQGFVTDEVTGETEYFEMQEEGQNVDLMDDYVRTMAEANPELSDAVAYGNANLSPELMAGFFAAVEDGNLDELHEYLEIILAEYDDKFIATPEEREETQSELEAEEDEQELEVPDMSSLYETEINPDLTYDHMDNADNTDDPVEKLLWSLSAAFHNNDITVDEAIEQAMSAGFSRTQLIETFNLLNS